MSDLSPRRIHGFFVPLALLVLTALSGRPLRAQVEIPEADDMVIKRLEYFYNQRKFPFDRIPAHGRRIDNLAQWQKRAALGPSGPNSPNPVSAWTSIGPAPTTSGFGINSGRVTAVLIDPANSQVIYAGGAQGGVWKTTNGGTSWTPLTDNQCSLAIGSLAMDPLNSNIIYAGTGELNFSIDSYYGCGILKSIDGGATWTTLGASNWDTNTGGATIGRIQVVPSATDVTSSSIVLAATSSGFFRSIDGGATWTRTLFVGFGYATDVVVEPSNRANVYVAASVFVANAANGVYKSTDGGVTFNKLAGGFPTSSVGRIALGISAAAPLTVYAAVQSTVTYGLLGIYKSIDGGTTWSALAATGASCASQCWYDIAITVDPANASNVYFSGFSLYRSTDGGATFSNVGSAIHVDHHAFAYDIATPNAIVTGSDGGVYRSANNGANWSSLNTNISLTQFYPGLSFSTTGPLRVMAGTQDNGTPQYTGSLSWPDLIGGDGGFTATNPTTNVSFGETQWGGGYSGPRRSDVGYNQVITGINLGDNALFIPPLVMDNARPATLYFGTSKLYKTTNSGGLWSSINNTPGFQVSAIGPAEFDPSTVYIGGDNGSVQVTTNAGANWATRTNGLPFRYVTDIAVHRSNSQTAYLSVSGFGTGHVFKTTNGGVLWNNVSGNLPDLPVNSLVLLPGGELDVGTDLGVYRSSDDGATWNAFANGLPSLAVDDLAFNPGSNTLYAATHGRGMYMATVTVATPATLTAINNQPGGAMPNTAFTLQPAVSIRSAAGDLVAGATNSVTAAIATGTGTLNGTNPVAAVNGVASFTNLSINGQGTGFSLIFSSTGLTSSTSNTFNVGVLRGDINLDGVITATDAQSVLQGVIGITLPAGYNLTPNGDANCSGGAQVIDAQLILRKVVGGDVTAYCVGKVQ